MRRSTVNISALDSAPLNECARRPVATFQERAGPAASKRNIRRLPSEYFKLVYVDTVSLYEPALRMANASLGSRRILFGCDCPFWGLGEGLESIRSLDLPAEDQKNIFYRNAEAILKLE